MEKENQVPEFQIEAKESERKKKRKARAKRELRKRQEKAARNVRGMRMYGGSRSNRNYFRPGELRLMKKESEGLSKYSEQLSEGSRVLTGRGRTLLKSIREGVKTDAGFSIFVDSPVSLGESKYESPPAPYTETLLMTPGVSPGRTPLPRKSGKSGKSKRPSTPTSTSRTLGF